MTTVFSILMVFTYLYLIYSVITQKFTEVFSKSSEYRILKYNELLNVINSQILGKSFEINGTKYEADNATMKNAIKSLELSSTFIFPILNFFILIPAFLFINGLAIALSIQITIALIIVLFTIIFPAYNSNKLFNGKKTFYSSALVKYGWLHVFLMAISIISYALGIAFFIA